MAEATSSYLHMRVLVNRGKRAGQRGVVVREHDDGTLCVGFVIPVGGGSEETFCLPEDLTVLGPESSFKPILNCFGDDPFSRLRP